MNKFFKNFKNRNHVIVAIGAGYLAILGLVCAANHNTIHIILKWILWTYYGFVWTFMNFYELVRTLLRRGWGNLASFLWIFWPFSAHFSFGQAHFFLGFLGCKVFYLYSVFCIFGQKNGLLPTFFWKVGTLKPLVSKGLRVFWSKAHFFL